MINMLEPVSSGASKAEKKKKKEKEDEHAVDSGRRSSGLPFYLEGGNKWNEARETFGVSRHSWREKWEGGRATCRVDSGETKAGREEKRKKCLFRQRSDFSPPFPPLFPAFEFSAPTFPFFPLSSFHANLQAFRKLPSWKRTNFPSFPGRREGSKAREGTWSVDGRGITGKRIGGVGGRNGIPMEGA